VFCPAWIRARRSSAALLLLFAGLLLVSLPLAACGGGDDGVDALDGAADRSLLESLYDDGQLIGAAQLPGRDQRAALTFMAGFRAQANLPFVAAYVAAQHGYFDQAGLDVEIRHSSGGAEHLQLLLAGEVDVTTQPTSELLQRRADPGAPLVAIALFGQTGDLGYAVRADSGIASPADFRGKIVGFKGVVQAEFRAMLHQHGLAEGDLQLVSVGFNPVVLAEGEVDVYPVFLSNEPDTLERVIGVPVRLFRAADDGVPTLGVTYVVTEDALQDAAGRDVLRRFLWATLRGLQDALADPAAAIEAARAFIAADADLVHERFILDTELAGAVSDLTREHGLGWFTKEQFERLYDTLVAYGGIASE